MSKKLQLCNRCTYNGKILDQNYRNIKHVKMFRKAEVIVEFRLNCLQNEIIYERGMLTI